jgi:putative nucleotidyltransferase with HDIG domain
MPRESILIVNDDPVLREKMATAVSSLGFPYGTASRSDEALDLLAENHFNLIISDIKLHPQDGLAFMNSAREVVPDSAFIIVTGYHEDYSYDNIIGAGADDFIRKPFTHEEFKNKLQRIIGHLRLESENLALIREQAALNERLSTLLAISTDLSAELDVDRLFKLIIGKVTEAMEAERTSLYVIDWDENVLWTKVAEQIKEIRLPMGQGISGRVAETGETLNVEDAWALPYFNREFDRQNDFRTRSVLCLPIKNQVGESIGVIQVINKKGQSGFNRDDETYLKGLTAQVGVALENSLLHEEVRLSFESSIRTLSATVDARHPLTAGHSQRVTDYSLLIAKEMGLSDDDLEVIKYAALMHDIGKIGIRDDVLLKNGPFSDMEKAEMKTHPVKTREILENFHFPRKLRDVPLIAACHHEKINGQGYPAGLSGSQLPLGSRIMAVADVFDALTSKRDYPKYSGVDRYSCDPMPVVKAVSIVEQDAGTHFDPDVVEYFLRILPQALRNFFGGTCPPNYIREITGRHGQPRSTGTPEPVAAVPPEDEPDE